MLPILIILAAVGGLIVNHYTDNWLSEYTSRVYLNLNLDVYVSGSISVVKSTSSTLWNYSHSNGLTSAGQFVGPELVEIDLKEHLYLQGPPPVTAAPVIVSIPSESLGSYFNVLAVLLFLVMVGAFVFHSAATRARLSIVCLSVLPLFGGVQPVVEAAAGVPFFEDISAQTADVGPARAYALAPASMTELLTTPILPTTNNLAAAQVSEERTILDETLPIAVGSTTLLASNSTPIETGFVEMENITLNQGSPTASTSTLPTASTSTIASASTSILENSSSIESGSPSEASPTVVEVIALPPSASDTEASPLSSTSTSESTTTSTTATTQDMTAINSAEIVVPVIAPMERSSSVDSGFCCTEPSSELDSSAIESIPSSTVGEVLVPNFVVKEPESNLIDSSLLELKVEMDVKGSFVTEGSSVNAAQTDSIESIASEPIATNDQVEQLDVTPALEAVIAINVSVKDSVAVELAGDSAPMEAPVIEVVLPVMEAPVIEVVLPVVEVTTTPPSAKTVVKATPAVKLTAAASLPLPSIPVPSENRMEVVSPTESEVPSDSLSVPASEEPMELIVETNVELVEPIPTLMDFEIEFADSVQDDPVMAEVSLPTVSTQVVLPQNLMEVELSLNPEENSGTVGIVEEPEDEIIGEGEVEVEIIGGGEVEEEIIGGEDITRAESPVIPFAFPSSHFTFSAVIATRTVTQNLMEVELTPKSEENFGTAGIVEEAEEESIDEGEVEEQLIGGGEVENDIMGGREVEEEIIGGEDITRAEAPVIPCSFPSSDFTFSSMIATRTILVTKEEILQDHVTKRSVSQVTDSFSLASKRSRVSTEVEEVEFLETALLEHSAFRSHRRYFFRKQSTYVDPWTTSATVSTTKLFFSAMINSSCAKFYLTCLIAISGRYQRNLRHALVVAPTSAATISKRGQEDEFEDVEPALLLESRQETECEDDDDPTLGMFNEFQLFLHGKKKFLRRGGKVVLTRKEAAVLYGFEELRLCRNLADVPHKNSGLEFPIRFVTRARLPGFLAFRAFQYKEDKAYRASLLD